MWRDRLGLVTSPRATGDVVAFRMAGRRLLLVQDPATVRHVLIDHACKYRKGIGLEQARPLLGDGLLTSEGRKWHSQRARVERSLTRSRIVAHEPGMTAATDAMLERWELIASERGTVDLSAEMRELSLEILLRTLLGAHAVARSADVASAVTVLAEAAMRRMLWPIALPAWLPTRRSVQVQRSLRQLDGAVDDLVDHHSHMPPSDGLLSELVQAHAHDARQLRDEVLTLIVAGHDTTSAALTWTLYLIAMHPQLQSELIERQVSLRHVISEALRLYPPVWLLPRRASSQDRLGRHVVLPGTDVLVSPFSLHRSRKLWDSPECFRPRRFARAERSRSAHAYLPFGLGPRRCPGAVFALAQMDLVIRRIIGRFRVVPAFARDPVPNPLLTLRPPDPLRFALERRGRDDPGRLAPGVG